MARNGLQVMLCPRRTDRLDAIASEISAKGGLVQYCALDMTPSKMCKRFVEFTKDKFGRIDVIELLGNN